MSYLAQRRVCLYYRLPPESNRWLPGDRWVRPIVRRLLRGKPRPGGVDKVFINLCLGLDRLNVTYEVNLPFHKLRPNDLVGVLGRGRHCLDGYAQSNPIVAGIGLMTHPSEWPSLCHDYPVVRYLQHSAWANEVYRPYFGDRCATWPVGIDTDEWQPSVNSCDRRVDFLVYDKIMWDYLRVAAELKDPILHELRRRKLTFEIIRYGAYTPDEFRQALQRCRAIIFLCEHESQGIAYLEALSTGVPILAWDQGWCLDPNRFRWGQPQIPASSVPFFDDRCGEKFTDASDFPKRLDDFWQKLNHNTFRPRDYVLESLTLEKCARHFLELLESGTA